MRLLLLESEPANISRIQSIFSYPITLDHTPTIAQALRLLSVDDVDALIFCRIEWLPALRETAWQVPLVYLPLNRQTFQQIVDFPAKNLQLHYGPLTLYPSQHEVQCAHKEVILRKTEYLLLQNFLRYPGKTLQYSFLIQHTWRGWHHPKINTLHKHVSSLRRTLLHHTHTIQIKTVYGVGYKLDSL